MHIKMSKIYQLNVIEKVKKDCKEKACESILI